MHIHYFMINYSLSSIVGKIDTCVSAWIAQWESYWLEILVSRFDFMSSYLFSICISLFQIWSSMSLFLSYIKDLVDCSVFYILQHNAAAWTLYSRNLLGDRLHSVINHLVQIYCLSFPQSYHGHFCCTKCGPFILFHRL